MKASIAANIAQYVSLTDAEFEQLFSYMKRREVKKREFILQQGERCDHVHFLAEGCLKYFYTTEGEERIGQFFFEGVWLADMYSFTSREPSKMNISAIEDSLLYTMTYEQMQSVYRGIPKMERFGRLLIEGIFVSSQQRSASFLTQSPTEKYLQLVQTRPKVIERVPQFMIASYLGIKPESLSRIRKKIVQDQV